MTASTEAPRAAEWPALRPHLSSFDPDAFVRPVDRFVWEPVPVPHPAAAAARPLAGRRILLVGESAALVAAVAGELGERGALVVRSDPGTPLTAEGWDGIVDLNVTGRTYELGDTGWRSALARTTAAIQAAYGRWSEEARFGRHVYLAVTHLGGLSGHGAGRVPQPLGGIWAGLAKCLPRELPAAGVVVVDLDRSDASAIADAVEREYVAPAQFEVGYRDGVRHVLAGRPSPACPPGPRPPGPEDTVLITGGARGVGFAAARSFAETFGCRVVVTGRGELPEEGEATSLDDEAFALWRRRRMARARTPGELAGLRREIRRADEARTVLGNLRGAAADGLRITYLRCDCTDAEQVESVFAALGDGPQYVVHNAGIDEPARFDRKSAESVIRTVDVKVTGFAQLVRAILARPERRAALRLLSNVGSLAGRMGGMVGQIDYAAGNEALARLGFWARDDLGLPVQTLCWPTWERLGVIANYSAAVRYVSTLDPFEGARRWAEEIASGHTGETVFLGRIGAVLAPGQLRGFGMLTGHPDLPRLHALDHHLGEVEEYALFRSMRTRWTLEAGAHPCLTELRIEDAPAVPVGVVLEHLVSAGDWVVPEGWPLLHLREVHRFAVRLAGLRFTGGRLVLHRRAEGVRRDGVWQVDVTVSDPAGEHVASATLVYGPEPAALPAAPPAARPEPSGPAAPDTGWLDWSGVVFREERPEPGEAGGFALTPVAPADLWTTSFPPAHTLSPAAVETIVRETDRSHDRDSPGTLTIGRLVLSPGAQRVDLVRRGAVSGQWRGTRAGREVFLAEGVALDDGS
ncbi:MULTISPECIES: SDR family NAD(P)-dependent oxidoreductase [unclassified Streptomyces]|uniref:SDR family NAD(P)-dependent oxidoreductase n=1 Tax=unclassified Streptomyces TaxID=2593676 RepID=UPI003331D535